MDFLIPGIFRHLQHGASERARRLLGCMYNLAWILVVAACIYGASSVSYFY